MPGKILAIDAADGDLVEEGQTLIIMEAMKMELTIKAPCAGTIEGVAVRVGDVVEADSALIEIKTIEID